MKDDAYSIYSFPGKEILLVIHLVHEWNIVIFPEFNELKLVFHEAQPSGIQDFNELNEGNMTIFHEWITNKIKWKFLKVLFEIYDFTAPAHTKLAKICRVLLLFQIIKFKQGQASMVFIYTSVAIE